MGYPSFTTGEVLTAADMNAVGLWRMIPTSVTTGATVSGAQVTLAGQTNYTINGIFNTNFTEYLLVARMTSTNGDIYCQLTSGAIFATTDHAATRFFFNRVNVRCPEAAQVGISRRHGRDDFSLPHIPHRDVGLG